MAAVTVRWSATYVEEYERTFDLDSIPAEAVEMLANGELPDEWLADQQSSQYETNGWCEDRELNGVSFNDSEDEASN